MQSPGQEIPEGVLVTLPEPVLAVVTVRVWVPLCAAQTVLVGNTPGAATNSETITHLRRLRGVAKEIHAVDAERDLFILERQAERGILWRDWWHGGWRT